MGFLGVYKAIYDYSPNGEGELEIKDGDILYVLEKGGDDGWWKAKKKASGEDEDEPEGLIPNNYVEEVSMSTSNRIRVVWWINLSTECDCDPPEQFVSTKDRVYVGCDG